MNLTNARRSGKRGLIILNWLVNLYRRNTIFTETANGDVIRIRTIIAIFSKCSRLKILLMLEVNSVSLLKE